MSGVSAVPLLPLALLAAGIVATLLAAAFLRRHAVVALLALATLAAAAAGLGPARAHAGTVSPLLVIDGYAIFFMALIFAAAFAVLLLSHGYLARRGEEREEYYVLVLLATLGASVLTAAAHFVSFFLGLELLSVSLYGLLGYFRADRRGTEAAIKYLILAGASSAFLLFGMALVYAELGTMDFGRMSLLLRSGAYAGPGLVAPGLALILVGVGFKLALVPFHLWTPDVYQGAPAPVTAFLATVSKGGMFALLLRYFLGMAGYRTHTVYLAVALLAVASMIAGNVLGLLQKNVKRLLAYSSIAHLGYLLVAFLAAARLAAGGGGAGPETGAARGVEAVAFYLVAYFATTLATFGVLAVLSGPEGEPETLEDLRGLFWTRPWPAAVMTAGIFSLAGIPLTAGFLGKYLLLSAGVSTSFWNLVLVLALSSTVGLYYYLRVVVSMASGPRPRAAGTGPAPLPAVPLLGGVALAMAALSVIWFGVYPAPLLQAIHALTASVL